MQTSRRKSKPMVFRGRTISVLLLLLAPAFACRAGMLVALDFTTGYSTNGCPVAGVDDDCNRGTLLNFGGAVIITARTNMGNLNSTDIQTNSVFALGSAGVVYWGDMGNLGGPCSSPSSATCPGLGVRNSQGAGNPGITGTGQDQDEMIVFNWSPLQEVAPSSIVLTLQGINFTGNNSDDIWVFLETSGNTNPSAADFYFRWSTLTSGATLNFNTVPGLPSGVYVTQLGILERTGHSGIASITFEAVPEPAAFVLVGVPLVVAGLYRRKRKA